VAAQTWPVPYAWGSIGLTVAVAVGAIGLTVGVGLLFLKASTSVEELRTA
jgi:hypothetical protein